uniref:STEAP family member 3, metalloreductase n=1 Tax=Knipowitschia caucasica TaxID=637954 RepID=A0AAV2K1P6_KNICA
MTKRVYSASLSRDFESSVKMDDLSAPLLDPREPVDTLPLSVGDPVVCILGSGDFSRSLSTRLLSCGCRVVMGSRDPGRLAPDLVPAGVELKTQAQALEALAEAGGSLVFLALYPEHYPSLLPLKALLSGRTLVDVSNASALQHQGQSNAQILAQLFPCSSVVKGFNGLSAWTLLTGAHDASRQVLVCGDSPSSKLAVQSLCRRLGFSAVDVGGLCAARAVEEAPLHLFPSWRGPLLTTTLLFVCFYLYAALAHVLLPFLDRGQNNLHHLALVTVNQALPAVALVTLALVYMPGLFASLLQLYRGTKYRPFPDWLDHWMCARKQLGLLSFLCAALHAVYSVCLSIRRAAGYMILNAAFRQVKQGVADSWEEAQVWRSDLYLSSGILGLGVLSVLALTSLPSVGHTLNWREFTFVQSGLGYLSLALSVAHVLFFGWDMALHSWAYPYFLPPLFLLSLVLPCCVLIGRLLLLAPCCALRLHKIRRGWESSRHQPKERAETQALSGDVQKKVKGSVKHGKSLRQRIYSSVRPESESREWRRRRRRRRRRRLISLFSFQTQGKAKVKVVVNTEPSPTRPLQQHVQPLVTSLAVTLDWDFIFDTGTVRLHH